MRTHPTLTSVNLDRRFLPPADGTYGQILATLPKSRDLANSMRLLGSICRVGQSLLPSIQGLVAVTVLVSNNSAGTTPSSSGGGGGDGNRLGDGRDGGRTAADAKEESASPQGGGGGGGEGANTPIARGLFRYELIRDSPSVGFGLGAGDPTTTAFTSASADGRQSFVSADGTRGIRIRLKRLVEGPSLGRKERQLRELAGQSPVSSGEGVLFEALQEGTGYMSKTIVRVLSRGGAEEPPPGRVGAGASSGAGELLELFVESVRLLSSLCRERHTGNIELVRSLKGTSYEVIFFFQGDRCCSMSPTASLFCVAPCFARSGVVYLGGRGERSQVCTANMLSVFVEQDE